MQFISKRNNVFGKNNVVYKCYPNAAHAKTEHTILTRLAGRGLAVPLVRHRVGRVLVMENINGVPLPDALAGEHFPHDSHTLAKTLCRWFFDYYAAVGHSTTGEIRGDVNGRNFLITPGGAVWGVDFEEHCYGTKARDAGRLVAFIKTYNLPNIARRDALAQAVFEVFASQPDICECDILTEMEKELEAMRRRRMR